jgi:hypothetical protein
MSEYPSVITTADNLFSALQAERDELRAILAALLDDPWYYHGVVDDDPETDIYVCKLCDATNYLPPGLGSMREAEALHYATCPVLRKDELLGRA